MSHRDEPPDFAQLLGPFMSSIPERSRPAFLCMLERVAAGRYREWAEQSPPDRRPGLLACAEREEEIADRVTRRLPADEHDRAVMDEAIAKARDAYAAVFTDLAVEEQWRIQASAERQGASAWRGLAEQLGDATLTPHLEACAALEEANAAHLEHLLGSD